MIITPQSSDSDLYPERVSKDLIYKQIIADLEKAAELLPNKSTYTGSDIGRANKGAALGELAEVYLTLGNNWQKVVDLTTQVESLGFALNTNYADNFNPANENSVESLFEVQYNSNGGFSFWSNENQASWASTFMGPRGSNFVGGGDPTNATHMLLLQLASEKAEVVAYVGWSDGTEPPTLSGSDVTLPDTRTWSYFTAILRKGSPVFDADALVNHTVPMKRQTEVVEEFKVVA